eukprot:6354914-Lingulodinium_polyedra.AAC.1
MPAQRSRPFVPATPACQGWGAMASRGALGKRALPRLTRPPPALSACARPAGGRVGSSGASVLPSV